MATRRTRTNDLMRAIRIRFINFIASFGRWMALTGERIEHRTACCLSCGENLWSGKPCPRFRN